ncbi:MAG: hypothetical protein WCO94_11960 [Verrucomicrobiota bacterium]
MNFLIYIAREIVAGFLYTVADAIELWCSFWWAVHRFLLRLK